MNPEDLKPEEVKRLAAERPFLVVAAVLLLQGKLALARAKLAAIAAAESEGVPA